MASDRLEKAREVAAALSQDELVIFLEEIQTQLYGPEMSEDKLDTTMTPIIRERLTNTGPGIRAEQVNAELKSRFGD